MNGKILVYTLAYNAEKTIGKAIESVLGQTRGDSIEYHLMDNGSTDSTGEIIADYAKKDSRIIRHFRKTNHLYESFVFFKKLPAMSTDSDYFVNLDADDEYSLCFIKDMLMFMEENHLDCAACGTQLVDMMTGDLIYERVLKEDLIIESGAFADAFLLYRRYFMQVWGKIYKATLIKEYYSKVCDGIIRTPGIIDFELTLGFLSNARRAGILSKTLHTYNRYPQSFDQSFFTGTHAHLTDWIGIIRNHLLQFGQPLSKINQDYLHAIYLGQLESILRRIYRMEMSLKQKLELIAESLCLKDTQEMLQCSADPQFRNLAARGDFLQSIRDWVLSQNGGKENEEAIKSIFSVLVDCEERLK